MARRANQECRENHPGFVSLYSYVVRVGGTYGAACWAEGVGNRLTGLSFAGWGGEVRQMTRDAMTGKTGREKSWEAVDKGGRMAY